jgi:hypothetical protein
MVLFVVGLEIGAYWILDYLICPIFFMIFEFSMI